MVFSDKKHCVHYYKIPFKFKPACHIMPINYINRRCTQGSTNIFLHVCGCMFVCQVTSKMKAEAHILQRIMPFQSLLKDRIYRKNMQEFNSNSLKALNKISKNFQGQMLSLELRYFLLFPIIQIPKKYLLFEFTFDYRKCMGIHITQTNTLQ